MAPKITSNQTSAQPAKVAESPCTAGLFDGAASGTCTPDLRTTRQIYSLTAMREFESYQCFSSHQDLARPHRVTGVGASRGANFRPSGSRPRGLNLRATDAFVRSAAWQRADGVTQSKTFEMSYAAGVGLVRPVPERVVPLRYRMGVKTRNTPAPSHPLTAPIPGNKKMPTVPRVTSAPDSTAKTLMP